ncbi:hypothetical protein [Clostridium aceticum]|nr:hypothetical protein [Clostridium aceticum]
MKNEINQAVSAHQQTLFNETEALDAVKPSGRKFPVEVIEDKLPEEEQICDVCGNHPHEISVEITRELEIIPLQVKVFDLQYY